MKVHSCLNLEQERMSVCSNTRNLIVLFEKRVRLITAHECEPIFGATSKCDAPTSTVKRIEKKSKNDSRSRLRRLQCTGECIRRKEMISLLLISGRSFCSTFQTSRLNRSDTYVCSRNRFPKSSVKPFDTTSEHSAQILFLFSALFQYMAFFWKTLWDVLNLPDIFNALQDTKSFVAAKSDTGIDSFQLCNKSSKMKQSCRASYNSILVAQKNYSYVTKLDSFQLPLRFANQLFQIVGDYSRRRLIKPKIILCS